MTTPSWDGPSFTASDGFFAKYAPQVVALADGNFAVVWSGSRASDEDPDGGQTPIARLFDADRNPLGDSFVVADDLDGSQADFIVAATADGGFGVMYTDRLAASEPGTFLARFDKTGARVGDDVRLFGDGVSGVGLAGQADGSMIALEVVFSGGNATRAAVIDSDNALVETGIDTGAGAVTIGGENILDAVGAGTAFVELSGGASARAATLFALGADGAPDTATPLFAGEENFGNYLARVLPDGRAVVASTVSEDGASLLRVRLFGADGAKLSDQTLDPDPDANDPSQIVPSPDGGFLVLMTSGNLNGPDRQEASALSFDAEGAPEGEAFALNRDSTGAQSRAHGVWLEGGDFMAVWDDAPNPWDNRITGQGFDPSGLTAGHAPTDLALTGDPVTPGLAGQTIGTLTVVDEDEGDSFTFEFVNASDSLRFVIEGDELRYAPSVEPTDVATFNQVALRVTDAQFNTYVETLEIPFESTDPEPEGVTRVGTKKADKLVGKGGDDLLKGKGGKDKLLARAGDDDLQGGGGKDLLKGQGGDDRLDGGKGRDKLIGGGGADVFVLDGKGGPDRVKDFADGLDRIEIRSGASDFEALKLVRKGEDVLIKDGRDKLALLDDVSKSDLDGGDFLFS
ncbi:hypothetical protein [uncultured Albimonas sp.]|uniref:hypothetical protein n=1 Tax=uncultured Albimonas sp. TaxID=1331701 RepID=UPI0030EC281C